MDKNYEKNFIEMKRYSTYLILKPQLKVHWELHNEETGTVAIRSSGIDNLY